MMLGAAEAARQWARKMQQKDKEEGRKEGLKESRKEFIKALRAGANGNAELHRLLDEIENEGE